jgi:hypothetical protein
VTGANGQSARGKTPRVERRADRESVRPDSFASLMRVSHDSERGLNSLTGSARCYGAKISMPNVVTCTISPRRNQEERSTLAMFPVWPKVTRKKGAR